MAQQSKQTHLAILKKIKDEFEHQPEEMKKVLMQEPQLCHGLLEVMMYQSINNSCYYDVTDIYYDVMMYQH